MTTQEATTRPTALVTGSSSGIGFAITQKLLSEGYQVIGVARDHSRMDAGEYYVPESIDLGNLQELEPKLSGLAKKYPTLTTVVSNAGAGVFGGLEQFSASQIRTAIDLNLTSHLMVARAFVPLLKRASGGDIVFMGSEAALKGAKQGSLYCAAKFGLRGFAQALREECAASSVRVGIVHPGMVRTEFFDELHFEPGPALDNAILPGDVANAVWTMLSLRSGTVLEELVLSPQKKVVAFKK